MSLVVATSRLTENTAQTDAEKPAHFINYFRSPIEIEPDSEIAVESVKLKRSGAVGINEGNYFNHFWGEDPIARSEDDTNTALGETRQGQKYQLHIDRPIKLPADQYEMTEYPEKIEEVMNTMYADPRIFNKHEVTLNTDSAGVEKGVKIKITSRASGSNQFNQVEDVPYFNIGRSSTGGGNPSNEFTFSGAGLFSRTGASSDNPRNKAAVGILKNRPFALNGGTFTTTLTNTSATWAIVGLNRPHIQYKIKRGSDGAGGVKTSTRSLTPIKFDGGFFKDDLTEEVARPLFHTDYGIMISDEVYIFNSMANHEDNKKISHYEIKYWESGGSHAGARMTKAEFHASYDRVRFTGEGDGLSVSFGQKGNASYDPICGPALSKDPAECLKPITDTTYALYPVLSIGSGDCLVDDYSSYNETYKYPGFTEGTGDAPHAYFPGDDFFSNQRVQERIALNRNNEEETFYQYVANRPRVPVKGAMTQCDNKNLVTLCYHRGETMGAYPFLGLNASGSVDYKHTMTIDLMDKADPGYLGLGFSLTKRPSMALQLGFPDRSQIRQVSGVADGYVTETNPLVVTFTSTHPLEKGAQSSFIRLPGLTHKSFNGGQQSMSKILYHIPQFSNDGRETGSLYFAPGEKTYLSLNNPSKILLNSLQVQIVDVNEREMNSLTGTTQIVFHIRKRK
jgi:hypothetical protein